jgi:predicted Zn finger-like uncharacterized protein
MDLGKGMGPGANPRQKAFLAFPMATLIICPACGTRYETQAVFPPEGRKVRCSKCAHVWQATPVTAAPAEAAVRPAVAPQPAAAPKAPPPPQPAAAPVNVAMRGFAGIAQPAPQAAPMAPPPPPPPEEDIAAQVARMHEEAMAEAPAPEKRGGIFARLGRSRAAAPAAAPAATGIADASMGEASMGNGAMPGAGMGEAMFDAGMGDASMGDAELGIDPALAAQAFPDEHPSTRKPSIVTIGWLVLALVVGGVIGTFVLAPSAVLSVLPGASRLYALFGAPVSAQGLAFEGVRYGWTSEGGQNVLEVQGDVVNKTSSPVDVPTVVIALQDEKGDEISQWTTEIGEEQLAAGEHAPFLRQIPSPPSNVRSVKIRFAKAE